MSLKNALKEALQIMLDRKRNKYNDRFYEERSGNPTPNNQYNNVTYDRLPYNYNRPTHWGRIQNPQLWSQPEQDTYRSPGTGPQDYRPPNDYLTPTQGFDPSHGYGLMKKKRYH